MKVSATNIKLTSYEDLFNIDDAERKDHGDQVIEIDLQDLCDFKNHPFYVKDDERMQELVESIKSRGVIVPGIARKVGHGKYELISGHRRKHACELAGLDTMPFFVQELSDDEATIVMCDANIQREIILPSEKARAYKMKYEAMKHPGVKGEHTLELVGESAGESGKTVQRYIWLSRLKDELLEMVDNKALGFVQGTDISFLDEEQQDWVLAFLDEKKVNISKEQSSKLKEYGKKKELTMPMVRLILTDEKTKERRITLKAEKLNQFFHKEQSEQEIEEIILKLLQEWKQSQ